MKKVNLVASMPYHGEYEAADFIGVDRGVSYLIQRNKTMVAVVGDFDSISTQDLINIKRLPLRVEQLNIIKNETDLEAAINLALSMGYEAINIYGALGGRMDHSLTNINLLKKYRMLKFFDDFSEIFILNAGIHKFDNSKYKYFSIYGIDQARVSLTNFLYPLEDYLLTSNDTLCISNELTDSSLVKNDNDIIVILSK